MGKYNKDVVLSKLYRRRIKEKNGILIIPYNVDVGLKLWSMIGFLKMNYQFTIPRPKSDNRNEIKPAKKFEELGECKVCKKMCYTDDGLIRFYDDHNQAKLHRHKCALQHLWVINNQNFEIKKEVK